MFDPMIEEICRARADDVKPSALKRWQQYLRDVVDPILQRAAETPAVDEPEMAAVAAPRTPRAARKGPEAA